jgi:hypothetical protein
MQNTRKCRTDSKELLKKESGREKGGGEREREIERKKERERKRNLTAQLS